VRAQGASEDENFEKKPTPSKTNSSGCFGITVNQFMPTISMNIVEPFKKHGWASSGMLSGIILGAGANLWKSGSFLATDASGTCEDPFNNFSPFIVINALREWDLNCIKKRRFVPAFFHFAYPVVYVAPLLGFAIWNICTNKDSSGHKSMAKKGWHQISTNLLYPCIHSFALRFFSQFIRIQLLQPLIPKVDISGHAELQCFLTIHAIYSLQALQETGTPKQKKLYVALCAAIAITDAIWMYNSTASCHSVVDVACAVGIVGLTHLGIQTSKRWIKKGIYKAREKYQAFANKYQTLNRTC
jgi:hypothetical protein